jgi:hypothetical protein
MRRLALPPFRMTCKKVPVCSFILLFCFFARVVGEARRCMIRHIRTLFPCGG